MMVKYILNNYQVGAKLRTAPTDRLIRQERIDSKHTEVVFCFLDEKKGESQKAFCDRLFAKIGKVEG